MSNNDNHVTSSSKTQIIFKQQPEKSPAGPKMNLYKYPIHKILIANIKKIDINNLNTVFLCIFHINDSFNSATSSHHPFIEYYLWKYPKSNNKNSDLFIFPFQKYNKKKTVQAIANKMLRKLHKEQITNFHGFIQDKNKVYLFYEYVYTLEHWEINNIPRNNATWWITLDEICNSRRVMNFPIHKSVTELFYKHSSLIYLLDSNNHKIEIPTIAYYGNHFKLLPMTAVFGNRHTSARVATFGPHYYFGTYNAAIRHAGWTSTYTKKTFKDIKISNDDGKYTQGGVIRFILFLGKQDVILNQPHDKSHKSSSKINKSKMNLTTKIIDYAGEWAKNYNSIYFGRAKLDNGYIFNACPQIVVKSFGQQMPLTLHMLDMSTLKSTWNPCYDKYYIK